MVVVVVVILIINNNTYLWCFHRGSEPLREFTQMAVSLVCESTGRRYRPHPPSPFYYYSAQKLMVILPSHEEWKAEST